MSMAQVALAASSLAHQDLFCKCGLPNASRIALPHSCIIVSTTAFLPGRVRNWQSTSLNEPAVGPEIMDLSILPPFFFFFVGAASWAAAFEAIGQFVSEVALGS